MAMLRMARLAACGGPETYRVESVYYSLGRPAFGIKKYPQGRAVVEAPPSKTDEELLGMLYCNGKWIDGRKNPSGAPRDIPKKGVMGVRWVGPMFDGSGYAEAARNYVAALTTAGIPVNLQSVSYEPARSDYGIAGRIVENCHRAAVPPDYGFKIAMMTPDYFHTHFEPDCYNIGVFLWETSHLPKEWVPACNEMDEIWVCCKWNAQVAKTSGVTVPIRVFGCCVSEENYSVVHPYSIPGLDPQAYKFYSIFQWTERKNPKGLLLAYLTAFTKRDNVALVIKSYRSNFSQGEQDAVKQIVEQIKGEVGGGPNLPPVFLITWMLTKEEMLGLHKLGDCFVLPQRSEGWGMPHHEACMMGKPVITTGFGGNMDFTLPEHSYLVDYRLARVEGMPHIPWYRPHMMWSSPDIPMCRDLMRHVFRHPDEAVRKGRAAQKFVRDNFSWAVIGRQMAARLKEIWKEQP